MIAFYWKFTLSGQYELMWTPDLAQQVVPWFQVAARQWSSGTLSLWDPHMWGGQPLLGQAQPGVAYFLNWALFSIPLKTVAFSADILHWYFAVIHFMAALFGYLLWQGSAEIDSGFDDRRYRDVRLPATWQLRDGRKCSMAGMGSAGFPFPSANR